MGYVKISDLQQKNTSSLNGSEDMLVTSENISYKLTVNSMSDYIKNKTIYDANSLYINTNIIKDSITPKTYVGGVRKDWVKSINGFTGYIAIEITGLYHQLNINGLMNVRMLEANNTKLARCLSISWQWNNSTSKWDYGYAVDTSSYSEMKIRFSRDTVNSKVYVILGESNTVWNDTRISIEIPLSSYVSGLNLGFDVATLTTLSGITTDVYKNVDLKITKNPDIVPGTSTKITYDSKGLVVSGASLISSDIPNLDASKITSGTIDAARLPAYVDDVLEFANLASFPATGSSGKIYVALDTNKTYRWSGSVYVYITSGAVDSVNGMTGVVTVSTITGNAGTATTLQTARTLQTNLGTSTAGSFNGSANITLGVTGTLPVGNGGTGATTLTGLVKGNGTSAMSAAVAGTDYVIPSGSITGNAGTATTLQTARTIATSGDVVGTATSFNGSANITIPMTLANVGTAGTYTKVTTDAKGRITSGTTLSASDIPTLNQSTTGSAATLTTARTVQTNLGSTTSASFDGSANITPGVTGTLPVGNGGTGAITLTGLVKGNGTAAMSAAVAGTDYVIPSGSITGNAGTATTLQTARTINGVSFNGSSDILIGQLNGNNYISGGLEKPNNAIFGSGKFRYQMLSSSNLGTGRGVWNDVLWTSSYTGNDVKGSNALILGKDYDYIGFSRSNYDATSWTAPKEILHAGNYNSYVYTKTEIDNKLTYDITSAEFITDFKRGGTTVYGIEVNAGLLVNTGTKEVSFIFNSSYNYWLDNQNSYCYNANESYPINYTGNIGESISCFLDKTNNKIKILCSNDKSSFTAKIVLLYTK